MVVSPTACSLWKCKDNAFRPQSYIQTRMHHHNVSGCLLCVRQLWGGQSQDEVSLTTTIQYNTCIKIELVHKLWQINDPLRSFQGVRQDHQASLHRTIQPVHPERGRPQGHSQHQQRGGGAPARAWHHRRRPLPTEQAAGCLTAQAEVIH